MDDSILKVRNLFVYYDEIPIVRDVSFSLAKGRSLGIVGESGCGKTTLLRSLMMLGTRGEKISGSVTFCGRELTELNKKELQSLRGNEIAMIPQNALYSMDQTMTISYMFYETIKAHKIKLNRDESDKIASEMMKKLMLDDTERILKSYPFELSGGMCQRVSIALSMINDPKLLLGDEPTSALDAVSQVEVIKQLKKLKELYGVSIVMISHNIGVIASVADDIAVMYGGRIVEAAPRNELLSSPAHPYTRALIDAVPDMNGNISKGLDGSPPPFTDELEGCPFYERCPKRMDKCIKFDFGLKYISEKHSVGCLLFSEGEEGLYGSR